MRRAEQHRVYFWPVRRGGLSARVYAGRNVVVRVDIRRWIELERCIVLERVDWKRRERVSPRAERFDVSGVCQEQLLQRGHRMCRRSEMRLLGSVRGDESEQPVHLRPACQLWSAESDHERAELLHQPELPGAVPLT